MSFNFNNKYLIGQNTYNPYNSAFNLYGSSMNFYRPTTGYSDSYTSSSAAEKLEKGKNDRTALTLGAVVTAVGLAFGVKSINKLVKKASDNVDDVAKIIKNNADKAEDVAKPINKAVQKADEATQVVAQDVAAKSDETVQALQETVAKQEEIVQDVAEKIVEQDKVAQDLTETIVEQDAPAQVVQNIADIGGKNGTNIKPANPTPAAPTTPPVEKIVKEADKKVVNDIPNEATQIKAERPSYGEIVQKPNKATADAEVKKINKNTETVVQEPVTKVKNEAKNVEKPQELNEATSTVLQRSTSRDPYNIRIADDFQIHMGEKPKYSKRFSELQLSETTQKAIDIQNTGHMRENKTLYTDILSGNPYDFTKFKTSGLGECIKKGDFNYEHINQYLSENGVDARFVKSENGNFLKYGGKNKYGKNAVSVIDIKNGRIIGTTTGDGRLQGVKYNEKGDFEFLPGGLFEPFRGDYDEIF